MRAGPSALWRIAFSATLRARMPLPRLFRRREVLLPTLAGWSLLFVLAAGSVLALLQGLYPFLAPVAPIGHGLLVVEGWAGAPAFDEAVIRFRSGRYGAIVTAGGPIEADGPFADAGTWAEHAARELRERGIPDASLHVVATPASARDRTYLSAVMVRDWIEARGEPVAGLDVISLGPHGRRSRSLYRRAFGDDVEVGIVSVASPEYDPSRWWRSSEGSKTLITEATGLAWTLCCFHPGPRGSEEERWGTDSR